MLPVRSSRDEVLAMLAEYIYYTWEFSLIATRFFFKFSYIFHFQSFSFDDFSQLCNCHLIFSINTSYIYLHNISYYIS